MKYFSFLLISFIFFNCNEKKIKEDSINKTTIDTIVVIKDSIVDVIHCLGPERKPNDPYYFMEVDSPPKFKSTPKNISISEERKFFQEKIRNIILDNFVTSQGHLGLSGIQKILTQFEIDSLGNIVNIQIRAPHTAFEKETKRVIELLPKFIPAKHNGKTVSTLYNLPITFKVED
ncbi:TonB-like protein [Winogradskyella wandonensis]|uniref:TonB-like protein n=1 Tax=Winogradskyella wandonensis TaxID=1442586 RepID=A0A4R1KJR9_9FLAO|nr:energy transducer TonB [Winogradskyella wandonensis]TCK65036.1 TonB-like protein [Winogradskyella wandonensis]